MGIHRRPGPCTGGQEAIPSMIPRQTRPMTGCVTNDSAPTFLCHFFHQFSPSISFLCFLLQFLSHFFFKFSSLFLPSISSINFIPCFLYSFFMCIDPGD